MKRSIRKLWRVPQSSHTPESIYANRKHHRRDFLQSVGAGIAGIGLGAFAGGCNTHTAEEVTKAGAVEAPSGEASEVYPAERNTKFEYGRDETAPDEVARWCNFYEFTSSKEPWRYIEKFQPTPWSFEIDGLCNSPGTFDLDDLFKGFHFEERAYRHRCVERWAMCVPWTGFPLAELLNKAEPKPDAKFVAFETFHRPKECPYVEDNPNLPWPYTEGLTIAEAMNDLAFVATGAYGEPLLKQNGAPVRIVVPWKYGFKSIKSIVRITLTDQQPPTYWNTLQPREYGFEANVNPNKPHPRWSQSQEWMLGTREVFETVIYNGYGEFLGDLYRSA